MRALELRRLSPEHQRAVKVAMDRHEAHAKPKLVKADCMSDGVEFDSALEAKFSHYLEAIRRSSRATFPVGHGHADLLDWSYHPMRFNIVPGLSYTPDFSALLRATDSDVVRFTLFEVKGSWKHKNARDSRVRLVTAAGLFDFFDWYGVTPGERGAWEFEPI